MTLANEFFIGTEGGNVSPTNLSQPRSSTAGGPYMAQLGPYQFSLETSAFDTLSRNTEFRWSAQNRIGRMPAQQFLGYGEDTIELQGVIYPHFRGGLGQMAALRELAGNGVPMPLIYSFESTGQYVGLWCVRSIRDVRSTFMRNGAARKIEFTMSLTAYGEDQDVAAIIQARFSTLAASPDAQEPPPLADEEITEILQNSLETDALVEVYDDDWIEAPEAPPAYLQAIEAATSGAASIAESAADVVQKAVQAGKISAALPGLNTVMADIVRSAGEIADIDRDTVAAARLVIGSAASVKAAALTASNQLRIAAQAVGATTGRIEGALQVGGVSIVASASLGNVVRSGQSMMYGATEAARQLDVMARKIKL